MRIAARHITREMPYHKADGSTVLRPHAFVEIYELGKKIAPVRLESEEMPDPTEENGTNHELPLIVSIEEIENLETRARIVLFAQKLCEQNGVRSLDEIEQELRGMVAEDIKLEKEQEKLSDYKEAPPYSRHL